MPLLSFFFSVNVLVCYWEICFCVRRDYVEQHELQGGGFADVDVVLGLWRTQ